MGQALSSKASSLLQMENPSSSDAEPGASYLPTIADIIQVKDIFSQTSPPLPIELIDQIIDDASYWPHSSITLTKSAIVPNYRTGGIQDEMYMRTLPLAVPGVEGSIALSGTEAEDEKSIALGLVEGGDPTNGKWLPPRGENPARKIVFKLWSKDQGWSGEHDNHGTYRGSYTWFDAGIETPKFDNITLNDPISWPVHLIAHPSDSSRLSSSDSKSEPSSSFEFITDNQTPFLPPPTTLQRNIHAKKSVHNHTVVWHYLDCVEEGSADAIEAGERGQGWKSLDGTFVRGMKVGDCVTLWMRARFPEWVMRVSKATIDIYWAV
ncbi:hypothetical protein BJ138DRAFT_1165272 [Hygrophoropsis aurantiaca]|uniref:Uncharacterized protein n=1 Tax=Hygrophoropsis aurantiaca TaxID=72124 RepID=A0ACB7ZWJ5_9AGAM|nr:hypothetical protein BJ138DRAFT_1165272 [Hygrophoropsis aurantiaca]